ncbi:MAG: hypothetical protein KBF89_03135 [Acidimicrobiia bacterium]|nr:hypothetical protein [Acidimicrobiia bacterium]
MAASKLVVFAKTFIISSAIAIIGNFAVFTAFHSGSKIQVVIGNDKQSKDLAPGVILLVTIISLIIGLLLMWFIEKITVNGFKVWVVSAIVFALISISGPFTLDVDTKSKYVLSSMHIITLIAILIGAMMARKPNEIPREKT